MAEYLCPGVGCDEYVVDAATWFEERGRYVGRTCPACEASWLDRLTERELADLARDPFLSGAMLRQLAARRSTRIDAALAGRGSRALPPSLAAALSVTSTSPTVRLEPFWRRFRDDDGDEITVVEAELIDVELLEGDEIEAEVIEVPRLTWPAGHAAGAFVRPGRQPVPASMSA